MAAKLEPGPTEENIGRNMGRYELLSQLGAGGCGVVYVAEQTEPVRRLGALAQITSPEDHKQRAV